MAKSNAATISLTIRSVAASILATGLALAYAPAHAEFVVLNNNVLDADAALEWRKFGSLASQGAYNDALAKYDAGSTYRLPAATEVDALFDKLFPGFVVNDTTGGNQCANDAYPDQLAQAQDFQRKFGGSTSSIPFNAMYERANGQLTALFVQLNPYGTPKSKVCRARGNYDVYRSVAPPYPIHDLLVLVVRDAIDLKVPVITLYDYVHPRDVGLTADLWSDFYSYDTDDSDTKWATKILAIDYAGIPVLSAFDGLYGNATDFASGKSAPWVRLRSIDFTPVAGTGGACTAATDTILGNGLCRRNFVGNYQPWHVSAASGPVPGSNIYGQQINDFVTVDNVVVEQIWENMSVDYAPTTPANTIRPKSPGWSIYITIKKTSIAAGDVYDFDPAYVDPTTLKLGAKLAPMLNYQASDIDGDGDTDYTYQFNTGATGVTCLDTRITLTGKTYWGVPVAGYDTVVPIGCTETVLMDVDPANATNTIRPNDNYNVSVAILGMRTASGDAVNLYPENTTLPDGVNRSSLKFGPAATPPVGTPIVTDVDGDATTDLLVNFNVFNAGIACGDTEVQLKGNKNSGIPIMAVDAIVTTDCETGGCHP